MPVGGDLKYIDFSVVPPQMTTPGDLKSGDFFPDQHPPPPTELTNVPPPPGNFPFNLDPYYPPPPLHQAILWEKRGSICQGLQLVEYLSNQTLACLYRSNKEETFSFLFATNNVHHARK